MMNFSKVASDSPSIFIASLLANKLNDFTCFAWHFGFIQYSVFVLFSIDIFVGFLQTGHSFGISLTPLRVRFSAIWGMIIFALYTVTVSPIPSSSSSIILILWTLARLTVVPSNSTGSKIATGLISPVLDGLHSISRIVVFRTSSSHLNAKESRGNFAVVPSDCP